MTRVSYPYHIHFSRATLKAFKQAKIFVHVKAPTKKENILLLYDIEVYYIKYLNEHNKLVT